MLNNGQSHVMLNDGQQEPPSRREKDKKLTRKFIPNKRVILTISALYI